MSKTPEPNALGYAVLLGAAAFFAYTIRDMLKGAPANNVPPAIANMANAALATKDPRVIRGAAVTLRLQGYTVVANALETEAQKYESGALT